MADNALEPPQEELDEPSADSEAAPATDDQPPAEPAEASERSAPDDPAASGAEPPDATADGDPPLDQAAVNQLLQQQGVANGAASFAPQPEATEAAAGEPDSAGQVAADIEEVTAPAPGIGEVQTPETTRGEPHGTAQRLSREEKLDLLVDVPLTITAELGRTVLPIADVLSLDHGSVIELDCAPADPINLLVNGQLVAKGEVVVVDDKFGIRITNIVSPAESPRDRRNDSAD